MHIVRYLDPHDDQVRVGILDQDEIRELGVSSVSELLHLSLAELQRYVDSVDGPAISSKEISFPPFVDGRTEVWAGGVTYARSRDARVEESDHSSVYERVYQSARPEIFFKSVAWRVVTDGDQIRVRGDSALNVPEPELALVVNARAEIIGYTVCNDVSSRSIEGENPLYLPQAKVYAGSCALGRGIRPSWELANPNDLEILVSVLRGEEVAWSAACSTGSMCRSFSELVEFTYAEQDFPDGVVLSTGTGAVPPIDFTLAPQDVVRIEIAGVGQLSNVVGALMPARTGATPDVGG